MVPSFSVESKRGSNLDSESLLLASDGACGYLRNVFRIMGIPINSAEDSRWWLVYNVVTITLMFYAYITMMYYGITDNHEIYSFVALCIFGVSSLTSYIIMSWMAHREVDVFTLLLKMAAPEVNSYGRRHSTSELCPSHNELRYMCNKWLFLSGAVGTLSYSLILVKNVQDALLQSSATTWVVLHICYIFFTAAWLLPVILIRVSCYFMEKRILNFVVYVEQIKDLRAARMEDMMEWYGDIYAANSLLSDATSPLVTQQIVLLSPCVIFLLQGVLLRHFSTALLFAMCFWVISNTVVLYICTASAAQLDAANIRLEIAFASVSSTLQFSSSQSISEYRLALAKIRAVPFGINFFGLRKRVSYDDIWRITSVVGSAFIFMLTV